MVKQDILTVVLKTPIGIVSLIHTNRGIKEINLDKSVNHDPDIVNHNMTNYSVSVESNSGPLTGYAQDSIRWVEMFFDPKSNSNLKVPAIDNEIVNRDNFTGRVLRSLMENTERGTTVSYAKLAAMCGSPKACRAVGQAMRANPIPLLVPCHRVIASDGGLGHYMSGKGDNIKAWLLEFEKSSA
ncbi:methylated-DNA--protein-cysteine methyltransferase-like [Ciona intestinalis]